MARLAAGSARRSVVLGALLGPAFAAAGCGRILLDQLPEPATRDDAALNEPALESDAGELDADVPPELDPPEHDAAPSVDAELDGAEDTSDGALTADASTSCDLSGSWAAQLDVQLSWPGPVLAAGSGTLRVWARAQVTHGGDALQVSLVPCNVLVPDFALNPAVGSETYGITYPPALFDRTPSPFAASDAAGSITGTLPGGSVALSGLSMLMGVTMQSPLTDSWPGVSTLMQVDTDTNGKPAISASYKSGGAYDFPSINAAQSARSDIAYLAARMSFTSAIDVSSCDVASGNANVTAFDTHIVGCRVVGTGADCTTAQRDFIDAQRPAYAAGAASMRLARVAAGASCAVVRGALP